MRKWLLDRNGKDGCVSFTKNLPVSVTTSCATETKSDYFRANDGSYLIWLSTVDDTIRNNDLIIQTLMLDYVTERTVPFND